jgi:hypothetical protein
VGSVHQGPVNRKGNEIEVARADFARALRRVVEAEVDTEADFARREVVALEAADEVVRDYCEQELQAMSDGFDDELLINGVLCKRSHEPAEGKYHSLSGTLRPRRALYREVGVRNGPTYVPLELAAGLVEGATPALARSIALDRALMHSREVAESAAAKHRHFPSRTTIERIGLAIGLAATEASPSIERYLRPGEKVPDEAIGVSVGLDRTSVPYEEEREEGAEPKTRRRTRKKPYERTPPEPVDVNYRMDYVGTVSLVDGDAATLTALKYFATHDQGPDGIIKRMMADVRSMRRQRPDLDVSVVQDGAKELWKLLRTALKEQLGIEDQKEAVDRYHLSERLGKVLKVTVQDDDERDNLLAKWEKDLDDDDEVIDRIEKYIEDHAWLYGWDARATLLDTLTYIQNNKDRMRYVTLRAAGLPVGSGATEGSCKSLVGSRMKRSGQRWHHEGAGSVGELRAIHQSGRLSRFWKHLRRRYMAHVTHVMAEERRVA